VATFNQPAIGTYDHKFSGIATMMRLPHVTDPAGLDVAIAGVPYDMGTFIRPGARFGPAQIRDMSRFIRKVNPATGIAPFDMCQVADLGDAPVNPVDPAGTHDKVAEYFAAIAAAGAVPLVAGGDHTVPLMVLRGLQQAGALAEPVGLIQIDAHADVLMTDGDVFEGEETNHATFARLAVEEGVVDPKRSVQIGLRGSQYSLDANRFAEDAGIAMIYQHQFEDLGPKAVVEEIRKRAGSGSMYFSIDIDGLDPSACPGTGYPEPGGLTMREVQQIVRGCQGLDFVGADVCEVSPPLDPSGMTALVGAHLLFEQLCLLAEATARRKGRLD
jgi:guanidinopropionase